MGVYSSEMAVHYAAYRPPLHGTILEKCLGTNNTFQVGLDVGSGTGYSTIALAKYCQKSLGIEPSQAMVERAQPDPRVEYRQSDCSLQEFRNQEFDLVAFAGTLWYVETNKLLPELIRVCKNSATILVYDFAVTLDQEVRYLQIDLTDSSEYDYSKGFPELESPAFRESLRSREQITFFITPSDLAHLLLSEQAIADTLNLRYGAKDPFDPLTQELEGWFIQREMNAAIFYTKYTLFKD